MQTLCVAIAVIAVLAGSAFAGPIGVWLSCGVGGCAVLLVLAAVQFRQVSAVTTDSLDPLIHAQAWLRIVVTLANLPHGDELSFRACRRCSPSRPAT